MESPRLSFLLQKCLEQMRSLHRHDADRKGFGHSPTSILNLDLKNTIQKLQVGTNLPCLPFRAIPKMAQKNGVRVFTLPPFLWRL